MIQVGLDLGTSSADEELSLAPWEGARLIMLRAVQELV